MSVIIDAMHHLIEFIIKHSSYAPWTIFGIMLLAGINIPISIDVILIVSAFLAAKVIPEYTFALYLSVLFGCYFSAWLSYLIGRVFGTKLLNFRWVNKFINFHKLEKIKLFYEKYGFFTLLVGRFIPFGIRNCIFMTTGMSKMKFSKFILRDAIACFIWTSICFPLFYAFGRNYEILIQNTKIANLIIFFAFSVTVIGFIWYKRHKKNNASACAKTTCDTKDPCKNKQNEKTNDSTY